MRHASGSRIRDVFALSILPKKEQSQRKQNERSNADQNTCEKFILFPMKTKAVNIATNISLFFVSILLKYIFVLTSAGSIRVIFIVF